MTVEERLEHLEKQLARANRRQFGLLVLGVLVVGGLGLAWMWTQVKPGEETVRSDLFILADKQGKIRAGLNAGERGPALNMLDEKSEIRVRLYADKDGSGLSLYDQKGKRRAVLMLYENEPVLKLWDQNGKVIWSAP